MRYGDVSIDSVDASVYVIPTDQAEADGTLEWTSTTMVVVEVQGGGHSGVGWTYAGPGAGTVVQDKLVEICVGANPLDVPGINERMARACRNLGRPGLVACAISAVDVALWDLKACLLDVSLSALFGQVRSDVAIYGSGGFTTYDDATTRAQVEHWVEGWAIPRVKIKIGESWGADPRRDLARVALTREVAGDNVEVYVDANGGYTRKQAVRMGRRFHEEYGVTWFEEPVSSDDLDGLREVRNACDADVTAGEYGYSLEYFAPMVSAGAVDCLQVDATRCGGYTIWLRAAAVAAAHSLEVSGHCAPNLHAHVATAVPNLRHLEYFHDHHRIETMLFDGTLAPDGGELTPVVDCPGHGLRLREAEAAQFRVW
ncbi:MAG: mandelate racemase [Actinomycetota bacterium]|nr:mandelate racemase [Actinomycetota bacterium]